MKKFNKQEMSILNQRLNKDVVQPSDEKISLKKKNFLTKDKIKKEITPRSYHGLNLWLIYLKLSYNIKPFLKVMKPLKVSHNEAYHFLTHFKCCLNIYKTSSHLYLSGSLMYQQNLYWISFQLVSQFLLYPKRINQLFLFRWFTYHYKLYNHLIKVA